MRHRIHQNKCFDLSGCSNTTSTLFQSCVKNGTIYKENRKPCSWCNMYFPMLMLKSLKSIACVSIYGRGRFVPPELANRQIYNFWCYGEYIRHNQTSYFKSDNFLEL